jgi:cation diffusion facilitator family transporter
VQESQNTARDEKSPDGSREKTIRKVTWIGLLLNLLIAGIKFATGIFGRSQALVADSVHSLTDSTTDLAVIAGSHFWSRPPDEDHPYGHQRLETLVTVFIGVMLAAAGIGVGWKAISTLHVAHSAPPKLIAALVALISIIGKETMYRWTAYIGRRIKSPVLAANAWHHRTDAISSLPVLIAISAAMVFPSWSFLDRVGAVIVSIFIVHASIKILWPAFSELIDAGAPTEIRKRIRTRALKNEGVLQVHDIRTRYISSSIQVDLHIVVEGSITVREGHDIADDVKNRIINEIQEVLDVIVHVDPPEKAVREEDLK